MPPRRPHSKSRLGCKQCKQRRVKCNEEGPVCYNCERRGFDCSFKYSGAPKKPSSLLEVPDGQSRLEGHRCSSAPLTSWSTDSDPDRPSSRTAELELMHHFATSAWKSLNFYPDETYRMSVEVPQWALEHPFLLDSIFSYAALHMAYVRRESAKRYGELAVAYQDRAAAGFRSILSAPRPDQCPAMFYASALISITSFALPLVIDSAHESPTSSFISLSRLLWGCATLVEVGKDLMTAEVWQQLFPDNPEAGPGPIDEDIMATLVKVKTWSLEADERLVAKDPTQTAQPIYADAVNLLMEHFGQVAQDPHIVLAWAALVPLEFVNRLEEGDPLTRLITMVYAVLLHQVDWQWWANGAARQLADELYWPVAAEGPEWASVARWVSGRVMPPCVTPPNVVKV